MLSLVLLASVAVAMLGTVALGWATGQPREALRMVRWLGCAIAIVAVACVSVAHAAEKKEHGKYVTICVSYPPFAKQFGLPSVSVCWSVCWWNCT